MGRGRGRPRGYARRWSCAAGLVLLAVALSAATSATQTTYTYDDAGRLTGIQYDDGAQVTYTLDAAGNRTQVTSAAATPVKAPTMLTAHAASDSSISLSWAVATGGTGQFTYTLYRNGAPLPQTITSNSTTDTGLAPNTSYSYTVAAVDTDGTPTPQSSSVSATTYGVPVISTFTGSPASVSQINLAWSASDPQGPGLSGFNLYRNNALIASLGSTTASYNDTGLGTGTSYTYTLTALDSAGDSNSLSTTISTYQLPVISAFSAAPTSTTSMTLTWTASDTGGAGGLTYTVDRGQTLLSCTTSPCTDTGLAVGTTYIYSVQATDAAGNQTFRIAQGTTFPSAPGTPTVSSITQSTATVTWTAASGTVSSYAYSLNGGATWVSTTATSVALTGLASGTNYTVLVHAVNAGGAGPNSSATFLTLYADTPAVTIGNISPGYSRGFEAAANFGSISPTTTSNGDKYYSFYDAIPILTGVYKGTFFAITGLSADPGQGWLISAGINGSTLPGNTAIYTYSGGTATWDWNTEESSSPIFPTSGTYTATIIHK